jgi:hypothetical protein
MSIFTTILFMAAVSTASPANTIDTTTNTTVIQVSKAGISPDIIKAKIKTTTCIFDLSLDALVALKKEGVSDEVVNAMITSQAVAAASAEPSGLAALNSGIYYSDTKTKEYVQLEPTVLTNVKSGGFGEALKRSLVSGLINAKTRAALSGREAQLKISSRSPHFIFVFDPSVSGLSNSTVFGTVQSPNEFILVHLEKEKKCREVVIGKTNSVGANIGIDEKLKVSYLSKKLKPGVYEVTFDTPIDQGEYCFMFASSSMYQGGMKVYDFSIL